MHTALLLVFLYGIAAPTAAQQVRYVDADATGAATGQSWADAFPDLQAALAVTVPGHEIWVAEGTYSAPDGFDLPNGVRLRGGFDGTETSTGQRDWQAHPTLLLRTSPGPVVIVTEADVPTVLDGFVIPAGEGDGITLAHSSVQLFQLRIQGRTEVGVRTDGGEVSLDRVVIEENQRALLADTTLLIIRRSAIRRNEHGYPSAAEGTAGIAVYGGTVRIEDSVFEENRDASDRFELFGGGLLLHADTAIVLRTHFRRNRLNANGCCSQRAEGGGAFVGAGSVATFQNCTFESNRTYAQSIVGHSGSAIALGGGLASDGVTTCINCVFAGNTADIDTNEMGGAGGSAIHATGPLTLNGVTVVSNHTAWVAPYRGTVSAEDLSLSNAVLWSNTGDAALMVFGEGTVTHALIEGGYPDGTAILDANPVFVRTPSPGPDTTWGTSDDDYGDLRLQAGSPAIDFGDTALLPPDTYDLDGDGDTTEPLPLDLQGNARVLGASVDLGPYEGGVHVATEPEPALPTALRLAGAYPNPFTQSTRLTFDLPEAAEVTVTVFDALGRAVRHLTPGRLAAGASHSALLDASGLPSGIYLYRITALTPTASHTASGTVTRWK